MATKKQKRAAGEARAKMQAEQRRQAGLEAQRISREQVRINQNTAKMKTAVTTDDQPPLNYDDYDPFNGMTVGEFQDKIDRLMPLFLVAPGETEAPIRKFLNEGVNLDQNVGS